jgi:hypothetical protein
MCTIIISLGEAIIKRWAGDGERGAQRLVFFVKKPKKTGSRISGQVRSVARTQLVDNSFAFLIIHAHLYKFPGTHRKVMIQKAVVLQYGMSSPTHPFPWLSH